ncbi:hypothetical protein K505DRAFT_340554 [Melanomma pulvis-pyrius CBS 109.77]|uniref:Uncharacterized protein n=1 Tax=Melanomma pulvis-pyrius CBS 109.77 TaxID=1314802 RepID=A0A6A6X1Q4_9PLEO|nr:hypothetical protein K505DRAFT_340554 [Melanomma pulvis-pyrius CBS 109.77]
MTREDLFTASRHFDRERTALGFNHVGIPDARKERFHCATEGQIVDNGEEVVHLDPFGVYGEARASKIKVSQESKDNFIHTLLRERIVEEDDLVAGYGFAAIPESSTKVAWQTWLGAPNS